jgi:predicted AlkP superfamily phosphohydrolase/phosphomutase
MESKILIAEQPDRLLIIGLDGATFDLIKLWVGQGLLPTLGRLLEHGSHSMLDSVPNMNSAPAWTSFATGKNPGKHGIYYFDERIAGTYTKRYLNGSFRQGAPFWRILSDAGFRVGIINVPMTFPADNVNGFMLAGLDAPGIGSRGFCHPPQLIERLQREVGDYIIEPGIPGFMQGGKRDLAVKRLFEAMEKRYAYARHLLTNEPWDLFMLTFTATDAAQHYFWKDMDASHPEHDPEDATHFGDVILRTYQRLDQIIQELMHLAPDADVMLMSDHGGGFNQRGAEYLNPWLQELGLLHYESTARSGGLISSWKMRDLFIGLAQLAYHFLNENLKRETKLKLVRMLPGLRERVETTMVFKGIDWQRTKAYAYGTRDDIWINLAGREPAGIVAPGREYDELCDYIIDKLGQTRDVLTHKPAVAWAKRREELYTGENLKKAPDITIRWRTEFVIRGLYIPEIDKPAPPVPPLSTNLNNGGHRPNGILVYSGRRARDGAIFQDASIIDLAPTILYYFRLPVPDEMDGKVITELFDERYVSRTPPQYVSANESLVSAGTDYEVDDKAAIEERLRGLGYVE